MTTEHQNLSKLREENRFLRQAIAEAKTHLNKAAARLRDVLRDEVIIEGTPLEADCAMQLAEDAIAEALDSLVQASDDRLAKASPVQGGPTGQQGQFLAYIREYMKLNQGAAPTHAELQRFFNLTPPSVNSMLKRLDDRGFIRRIPRKARAIELTIDPNLIPPLEQPFA
jgi:repressor LexA